MCVSQCDQSQLRGKFQNLNILPVDPDPAWSVARLIHVQYRNSVLLQLIASWIYVSLNGSEAVFAKSIVLISIDEYIHQLALIVWVRFQ